jgi:hypothetical protein
VPLTPVVDGGRIVALNARAFLPAGTDRFVADARLSWMVGGLTDAGDEPARTTLARYKEPFRLTGLVATEHHGTDVGALATQDPTQLVAMGTLARFSFLQTQASLDDFVQEALGTLSPSLPSPVVRTAPGRGHLDDAMMHLSDELVPQVLDEIGGSGIVPVLALLDSGSASLDLADLAPTGAAARTISADLRWEPEVRTRMMQLAWYGEDGTATLDHAVAGLDGLGFSPAELSAVTPMLVSWSAGQALIVRVGDVVSPYEPPHPAWLDWIGTGNMVVGKIVDIVDRLREYGVVAGRAVGTARTFARTASMSRSATLTSTTLKVGTKVVAHATRLSRGLMVLSVLTYVVTVGLMVAQVVVAGLASGWDPFVLSLVLVDIAATMIVDLAITLLPFLIPLVGPLLATALLIGAFFGTWVDDIKAWLVGLVHSVEKVVDVAPSLGEPALVIHDVGDDGFTVGDVLGFHIDSYEAAATLMPVARHEQLSRSSLHLRVQGTGLGRSGGTTACGTTRSRGSSERPGT